MSEDKDFRDAYPELNKELKTGGTQTRGIAGVRTMTEEKKSSEVEAYTPTVIDYIRRCDSIKQAVEIVEYLVKQDEINLQQARAIKRQLKTDGIRSFGTKKEKDHYLRHGFE